MVERAESGPGRAVWLVAAGWAVVLAVLSPAAFRIDEPNIIAIARQIARAPLDPYGFRINWVGTLDRAWDVLANPPLLPAWLAGWAALFGWSEVSLHVAVIPFAALFLIALGTLASSFGLRPLPTVLLALASPAFVLGSQVVMPDVAMLACVTAAVAAAMRAERGAATTIAFGCLAAFAAPLLKYNGIIAIAVLAAVAWRTRRAGAWLIASMPLLSLALWSLFGWLRYGSPHLIALQRLQAGGMNPLPGIIAAFGIGLLPLVLSAGSRLDAFRTTATAVIAIAAAGSARFFLEYSLSSSVLYGLACGAATAFLLQARSRDAVLWIWLLAPVAMQFGQRFTSVRYLIAMLPPALLLWRGGPRRGVAIAATAAGALVLALTIADAETANLYRDFVRSHPVPRYSGHWGLQYYAERQGARGVVNGETLREPAIIAMHAFPPVTASGTAVPAGIRMPLRTVDCSAAANFYGNALANCRHYPLYLPFGFGTGEVETFVVTPGASAPSTPRP